MTDLVERHEVVVGDPAQVLHEPPALSPREQVVDGVRVTLTGDAKVGTGSRFTFRFADPATGRPVDGLRPYLAAAGHVVIMPADGEGFAHEHAETSDEQGRPVFALPGQTFGPELDLHADFPRPGRYRLWGQLPVPARASAQRCTMPSPPQTKISSAPSSAPCGPSSGPCGSSAPRTRGGPRRPRRPAPPAARRRRRRGSSAVGDDGDRSHPGGGHPLGAHRSARAHGRRCYPADQIRTRRLPLTAVPAAMSATRKKCSWQEILRVLPVCIGSGGNPSSVRHDVGEERSGMTVETTTVAA
ncbi:hypothetical protein ABT214_03375 [Micromonospora purpureochromogenes]|uniref:hypothetical protein n=1 Tax=Micromonospora purpureochromogenes TaxID=47872 RepID=UPI0033272559